jgi:hypothetical protein
MGMAAGHGNARWAGDRPHVKVNGKPVLWEMVALQALS